MTPEGLLDLSWERPTGNYLILDYRVQMSPIYAFLSRVSGVSTTFRPHDYAWGVERKFRVQACGLEGCGEWSEWSNSFTPVAVPSNPGSPKVRVDLDNMYLTLRPPNKDYGSPITHYELDASHLAEPRTVQMVSGDYVWTGLYTGLGYRFRVRACNAVGCSGWSPWTRDFTLATLPRAPLVPVVTDEAGSARVTVTKRTDGSLFDNFEITHDGTERVDESTSGDHLWGPLTPGATYVFSARICSVWGCGPWTPAAPFTAPS